MKLKDLNLLSVGHTIQMTGAIYSGEGKTLLCFFPEESNDLPIDLLEMDRDDWTVFLRQADLLEAEILVKSKNGALTKAIVRKGQRQIDSNVSWRVYKRDGYKCQYCANDNIPLTVDHLVLWEVGGPSVEANLLSSCKKCNRKRGNTQYADWLQDEYYLRVSQNLDHSTRMHNESLVGTLDKIPRNPIVRSR